MNNVNDIVVTISNMTSVEDKYAALNLLKNSSPNEFLEVKKAFATKGFNISDKKLEETTPMTMERLMELTPSIISSAVTEELEKTDLSDKEKAAILAELNQAQVKQTTNSGNRGFGGEDLVLSAKWLGAASAALTAGSISLMREDISLGSLAGSIVGVAGGYFAADYLDTKLAGKSGFVRYLAALSTGAACGATGNFLGSLAQDKFLSSKEDGVDINITIANPGESQVLEQLVETNWC